MRRLALLAVVVFFALCPAQAADDDGYPLDDTRVVTWDTKDHARQFRLLISLPRNFDVLSRSFPVIYLLDADYSFAITRNVLRHFTDRDQLDNAVIVGIAYPGAERDLSIYQRNRVQDYTPTRAAGSGYTPEMDAVSGGAPALLQILSDELLPAIDARYHTDPKARMLVGHSYGGLFAAWTMLTRPGLFRDYIIVSPSLWYDNKMLFPLARAYAAHHDSLSARVFWGVGSLEGGGSMAADMTEMDGLLKAAKLAGYESTLKVFDGETHNSVFPSAITRGLRVLDGFAGEDKPTVAPHS